MAWNTSDQPLMLKPSCRSMLKGAAGETAFGSRGGAFPMPAAALFVDDATWGKTRIALHAGTVDDLHRSALGKCLVNAPIAGAL